MSSEKKFLDQTGIEYLWSKLSLEDYPNNETLIAVLNAIDETKADKEELNTKQNIINGTAGQIIGFNENGEAVAQNIPSFITLITWTLDDIS